MKIKNFYKYLVIGVANRLVKYFTSRSLYGKAAMAALAMIGVIYSTSITELFITEVVKPLLIAGPAPANCGLFSVEHSKLLVSLLLLLLASYWIRMAYKDQKTRIEAGKLVFEKKTQQITKIGKSRVFAFCGSVTNISGIDIVVTSENTDLNLAAMTSTSVSGRVRSLAANRDAAGEVVSDNIGSFVQSWKASQNKFTNFALGHCIECSSPYQAAARDIKTIILAIAIKKNSDGTSTTDEAAINAIVAYAIDTAIRKNQPTLFIPIFGLGSGNLQQGSAIRMTTSAVQEKLSTTNSPVDVYLGVYRFDDLAELCMTLERL